MTKAEFLEQLEAAREAGRFEEVAALWEARGETFCSQLEGDELDLVEACLGALSLVRFAEANKPAARNAAAA